MENVVGRAMDGKLDGRAALLLAGCCLHLGNPLDLRETDRSTISACAKKEKVHTSLMWRYPVVIQCYPVRFFCYPVVIQISGLRKFIYIFSKSR